VAYMILDTYVLGIFLQTSFSSLRLLRLLRLARFSRLVRALPGLMTMSKAMLAGTRAAGAAVLMLVLLIYVFAIAMYSLLKHEPTVVHHFGGVGASSWTLLLNALLMDGIEPVFADLRRINAVVPIIVLGVFILISVFIVLNMMLGIFCEVVAKVAECEAENGARLQVRQTLSVMLRRTDTDDSGRISRKELSNLVSDPDALEVLNSLQVNVEYFLKFLDMIYLDVGGELPISYILDMIIKHRGTRMCSMEDMARAANLSRWSMQQLLERHDAGSMTKNRGK